MSSVVSKRALALMLLCGASGCDPRQPGEALGSPANRPSESAATAGQEANREGAVGSKGETLTNVAGALLTDHRTGHAASKPVGAKVAAPTVLGVDPPMGWSTWSYVRQNPTESTIQAHALALHDHLASHGYTYVNIDDFYYLNPSTTVDKYGRWVVDSAKFPGGMAAMGAFIHGLGLKFGLYVTPGIPTAAVQQNTPIEGTPYHASDVAMSATENQYNFGGSMVYIDFAKPGAQAFIDSWARLFASYGIDYLKLDGVGSFDIPDVRAWSTALKATGRDIHLELSNSLSLADAPTWSSLANGWRIEGDIECYCSPSSYPLTSWANIAARFTDLPPWQPFSRSHARNDPDSLELGNGDNSGLSLDERRSQMSLWAISAAPLFLGTDLTKLDPTDVELLTNEEIIAIDQSGVAGKQVKAGEQQTWTAPQLDGSLAIALFNLTSTPSAATVTFGDLGLPGPAVVRDAWARTTLGTFRGSFQTVLPPHGSAMLRLTPKE